MSGRLPVIGELWARGERPPGSREQVCAWLMADPQSPSYATVIETFPANVYVFGYGSEREVLPGYQAVRRYSLDDFLSEWWPV